MRSGTITRNTPKMHPQEATADPFALDEQRVRVRSLIVDGRYQIRGGDQLNRQQVRRYADAMAAGQVSMFPAVKAWRVAGSLYLIDGFHRLAAAKFSGCEDGLRVEVVGEGSFEEGRWLAFEANRQHGLPIKTRAMRNGFKAYVGAKKHLGAEGKPKSYRDMARDLGVGHTTIRNWMAKDFPRIYRAMQSGYEGHPDAPCPESGGYVMPPDHVPMTPLELLEQARTMAARRPGDAGMNADLLDAAERLVEELRARPRSLPF